MAGEVAAATGAVDARMVLRGADRAGVISVGFSVELAGLHLLLPE